MPGAQRTRSPIIKKGAWQRRKLELTRTPPGNLHYSFRVMPAVYGEGLAEGGKALTPNLASMALSRASLSEWPEIETFLK